MLDFFNKLFFRENSGATAKERLKLVLLSDHISLAPDVIERLKADLLEVISRYVEIDQSHADVTFEHREREIAMLANVPILGLRDGRNGGSGSGGFSRDSAPVPSPVLRAQPDAFAATPVAANAMPNGEIAHDGAVHDETVHDAAEAVAIPDAEMAQDTVSLFGADAENETTPIADTKADHVEGVKANQAPKRAPNNSQRRRRRRKPSAPKKAPNAQPTIGGIGAMGRPAQA